MATGKSNAMQGIGQSSSGENLKMQCTVLAGVMPPPFMPPYQISRPLGIPFIPPYQVINRPLLYPFMTPYTTSLMHYVPTAHGPLHASNDDKRTEVLYQSPEVPLEQNVEAQQTLGGPSEEAVRSVIHDIINDVNEIRSVPASPDLENNDVGHEINDEVNELVLGCPDLENKDVAPVCNSPEVEDDLKNDKGESENLEPFEGMIFQTISDAQKFYNANAKRVGFGMTIIDGRRKNDRFSCHCGGQSRRGKETISHIDSSKIGCKASVRVRHDKDTNTYIMYDVILEHNHILHPTAAMYLRSHRKICTPEKAEIMNMRSVAKTTLSEFIVKYTVALDSRFDAENKADLKSMDTEAYLKTCSPFEKQAATIYTRSIFQKF
ncbi:hypothetical protein Taro_023210 [Colocasia esculenta]|uniref:Protein FAR1-RELATED SEQUENCE n=1 Tax=Colocasia esculenta TaxID=4460 RepID=A0A843VDT2_COLES|nr:hypothetical protein [Colocasia esculenta]